MCWKRTTWRLMWRTQSRIRSECFTGQPLDVNHPFASQPFHHFVRHEMAYIESVTMTASFTAFAWIISSARRMARSSARWLLGLVITRPL
jgi:hypothetical protein